jgi:hypothetical protein
MCFYIRKPKSAENLGEEETGSIRNLSSSKGSILLMVIVFMMIFTIIGLAVINSSCYQEIRANSEVDYYRANLTADAALEFGKMWLNAAIIRNNKFPENDPSFITGFYDVGTVSLGSHGGYALGIYCQPGNAATVVPGDVSMSYAGYYVITTTATISTGIPGTMDTIVCKTIQIYIQRSSTCVYTAGPMNYGRVYHTATLLDEPTHNPNDKVLITGGWSAAGSSSLSAELYNPATNTFTPTGDMKRRRGNHTATQLQNGQVLIAGGADTVTGEETGEIYSAGSFSLIASTMCGGRECHTATLLNNGDVLIVGGAGPGFIDMYDPASGFLRPNVTTVNNGLSLTSTMLLPSGNVLNAGGGGSQFGQIYDISIASVQAAVPMQVGRLEHSAVLLNTGKVLLASGYTVLGLNPTTTAELYDPNFNTFTLTGSLTYARILFGMSLLKYNGHVIAVGGQGFPGGLVAIEEYDPGTGLFTINGELQRWRFGHTVTRLNNGLVLITGGSSSTGYDNTAELYGTLVGTYVANSYREYPTQHIHE